MGYWETGGQSDDWWTPRHVFLALGCTFDLDVAGPAVGGWVPAARTISADSLSRSWDGFIWMNPPFGGRGEIAPWLQRFFDHGDGIALTPDRTSAPWFREAAARADAIMFTPKLRFIRPDGTEGKSPSNGTALFAAGDRATAALQRAKRAGLGFVVTPS